jgi:hypothetical protein
VSLHAIVTTVNVLAEQGIAAAEVLAGSGIPPERLLEPARLINHHQELTVFDNARRLSQDDALGLRLGHAMHTSNYGILGYTMLVSPTLRVALETAIRFPLLLASYFTLRLEERGKDACLLAEDYRYREDLLSFNAEMCLSSMWTIARDCMGVRWSPRAVHMCFARPRMPGFIRPFSVRRAALTWRKTRCCFRPNGWTGPSRWPMRSAFTWRWSNASASSSNGPAAMARRWWRGCCA